MSQTHSEKIDFIVKQLSDGNNILDTSDNHKSFDISAKFGERFMDEVAEMLKDHTDSLERASIMFEFIRGMNSTLLYLWSGLYEGMLPPDIRLSDICSGKNPEYTDSMKTFMDIMLKDTEDYIEALCSEGTIQ